MTELRESILRNQIQFRESQANKLEEIVYFQIAGLAGEPEKMDSRLLKNLVEMDRLQTEIDELTVKLKAEESWEPDSYSEAKYIYTRPKAKPKPKKEPFVKWKEYPIEAPKKPKPKPKREPKPKVVKPKPEPKPKREPKPRISKPRKPAESREIVLLKKRRLNAKSRMNDLENKYEPKRLELEGRVRYFEEKLIELAEVDWQDLGHQKRRNARGHLRNAQKQLEELPETFKARREQFEEQLATLDQQITEQFAKEAS
jgi:hypothetical protein